MDVVALAQFDVGYAVATLGTATTPVHVSKLLRLTDELVFCFDGDAAGRKAAWRALEVSLPLAPDHKPVRFLFLPDGEDPDTYVRKHGKDAFEAPGARGARPLSQFLLAQLRAEADLDSAEGRARLVSHRQAAHRRRSPRPALRLQLVNEIAQLARDLRRGHRAACSSCRSGRASAARRPPGAATPRRDSPEWTLLFMPSAGPCRWSSTSTRQLLTPDRPESGALLAIRDACRELRGRALARPCCSTACRAMRALEIVLQRPKIWR